MTFQTPATTKASVSRTAETTERQIFHRGNSRGQVSPSSCAMLSLMFSILFLLPMLAASETAETVVVNAGVRTADPARPEASAIAVGNGRIPADGDDVSACISPSTRRIEARGATILPGFIDSHGHMARLGKEMPATVEIFGVEGGDTSAISEQMTPPVAAAVEPLAREIHAMLAARARG